MTIARLKLLSTHGDQTLSGIRFVIHTSASADETADLTQAGLRFTEGEPVVSTNVLSVLNDVDVVDRLFVMVVPPQFHLGYGVFTTAYVDRVLRRVAGAPLRYAAGRDELAFYMDHEVEQAREHIEAEVAEGYALAQRPTFVVEPRNLVGYFGSTPALHSLVSRVSVAVDSFQPVNFEEIGSSLSYLFRPSDPAASVLVTSVIDDLLVATVESATISRLRGMRWQGLRLLGYQFFDGEALVELPSVVRSLSEHHEYIRQLRRDLETSQFFTGRLAWLKQYALTQLQIMLLELDEETQK